MTLTSDPVAKRFFDRAGNLLCIEFDYDQDIDRIVQQMLNSYNSRKFNFDREIDKMSDYEFSTFLYAVLDIYGKDIDRR